MPVFSKFGDDRPPVSGAVHPTGGDLIVYASTFSGRIGRNSGIDQRSHMLMVGYRFGTFRLLTAAMMVRLERAVVDFGTRRSAQPMSFDFRPRRSVLAVPGSSRKMIDKAKGLPADETAPQAAATEDAAPAGSKDRPAIMPSIPKPVPQE